MTTPLVVRSTNPARLRFHRYVAVLLATTVPLVAVVELMRAMDGTPLPLARLAGPLALTIWAVVVARSDQPDSIPLVLATMWFTGTLVLVEAIYEVDVTSFDFSTAFGLMMLFAVLAGTLSMGSRLVWAGGLAGAVAAWVVAVGLLIGDSVDAIGVRAVVATAGVIFTTALVAELYDQLTASIAAHDRAVRLQDAVARCSEALLVHPDAFALHEAVRAVFEATDADYAYVDRTLEVDGEPGWEIVASAEHRVNSVGVEWQIGKYSSIPTTYEALVAGEAAIVKTSELTGDERELYDGDGILSEVSIPIFVGSDFRGSIGFVEYLHERRWTDAEIQTLWRAADMVGAYWKRQDDAVALKASNESKDKLLASVSHEIRTPLTAIVGLSEEIANFRDSMSNDELDELNRIIAVQSRELAELVEDLLVASRADFGNLSIRPELIDIRDQVERVLEGLRESTPTEKTVSFTGESMSAWADPLRVRQILRNLVTNAIKYGGDHVVVAVRDEDKRTVVVVSDTGSGVDEREAKLIFERYYRSAQSPTQPGSVGIGLAVSRQLAEMMGGTLEYVHGDQPHHRFELALPPAVQHAENLVPEPA
ncbi:MAG TPA: GAF domain-containing sensor histidine kinase [Acidimicrobiia bacterium]|nr:GAF domain-containing sensor histidine kinase [Acidimicrobiia bacterium]